MLLENLHVLQMMHRISMQNMISAVSVITSLSVREGQFINDFVVQTTQMIFTQPHHLFTHLSNIYLSNNLEE